MRLWLFERRAQAAAAPDPTPSNTRPQGASGTINMAGFLVSEEENPELQFPQSLRTFRRMLRTEPAVREAYLHTVMPIVNATWDIEEASDAPIDLEIAEMVRCAYFDWATTPFKQTLQLACRYMAQGYQVFELTEKVVTAALDVADPTSGDTRTLPARQFVTYDRWEHRKPETIYKWIAQGGVLTAVEQLAMKYQPDGSSSYGPWTIPAEDLVVFVCEQEGDDFRGESLLRAAYKPWKMKELVERIGVMSIEANGVGIRVAYTPTEAKTDEGIVNKVSEMLEDLRAGESNYMVFPGPKATASGTGAGTDGYNFEIATPAGGLPDFTPFLTYFRGDIKGTVLARFTELGHGQTGSRATSDSQSEVWYAALHATADYIASVHAAPIARLVDKNYPNVEAYPKLVARDIETKSLAEFAQANAQLVAAGAVETDRSYRAFVRQGLDAPPEDDPDAVDLEKAAQTEPETPAPPGTTAPPV